MVLYYFSGIQFGGRACVDSIFFVLFWLLWVCTDASMSGAGCGTDISCVWGNQFWVIVVGNVSNLYVHTHQIHARMPAHAHTHTHTLSKVLWLSCKRSHATCIAKVPWVSAGLDTSCLISECVCTWSTTWICMRHGQLTGYVEFQENGKRIETEGRNRNSQRKRLYEVIMSIYRLLSFSHQNDWNSLIEQSLCNKIL